MQINPYQPTATPDSVEDLQLSTSTRLLFDGVIQREDYASLLPNRNFLWWLQVTLLILLIPTLGIGLLIAIVGLLKDGPSLETLITIGVVCAVLAVTVVTVTALGRGWRSRTYLARFPDVLGLAQGEFNSNGLLMHDGIRQHWFGPTPLSSATVSKAGIRVFLPGSPYRYLAFTKRLFHSFDLPQALELQLVWQKKARLDTYAELNPVANLWNRATEPPEGAVAYKGNCRITQPFKSKETKQAAIVETLSAFAMLGVAAFRTSDVGYMFWGALGFAVICGLSSIQGWRRYFYGTIEQGWYQYGWISHEQLATCNNELGTIINRTEVAVVETQERIVALTTHSQARLFILREHVDTETEWQRILAMVSPSIPTPP